MARLKKNLPLRKKDFVFTEGETEIIYFERVKRVYRSRLSVRFVSCSKQSLTLVNHVIAFINNMSKEDLKSLGTVYVVFDKDSEELEVVKKAIKKAEENNFEVIFTNECFDLWILAHFGDFTDRYLSRTEIYSLLENRFDISNYNDHKANEKTINKGITDSMIVNTLNNHTNDTWLSNREIDNNPYCNVPIKVSKMFEI